MLRTQMHSHPTGTEHLFVTFEQNVQERALDRSQRFRKEPQPCACDTTEVNFICEVL